MTSKTPAHVRACLDMETDRKQMSVEVNVNHLKLTKAVRSRAMECHRRLWNVFRFESMQ